MEKITEISIEEGCSKISKLFNLESDFTNNLIPKLGIIIKEMYGVEIDSIETEKHFNLQKNGYYNMFADIYIITKSNFDVLIECKNPKQSKQETFNAFSQIMSYEFLKSKMPKGRELKYILATSQFDFMYFEFMAFFKLKYDVILNNENTAGFWINDL